MNNQFFTQLAETLKDRQELRMNIKKIDGDLVVMVTPNFKEEGKVIHMTGTPEEIDENFINEIKKPLSVEKAFESNADEVKKELEEEEEEDEAPAKKDEKKKPEQKKPAKKAAPKKSFRERLKEKEEERKAEADLKKEEQTEETETSELSPKFEEALKEETVSDAELEVKIEAEKEIEKTESEAQTEEQAEDEVSAGPSSEELFKHFMLEGKRLFDDRKYKDSEAAYQEAVNLKPDDKKAQAQLSNATKWVKAIEQLQTKS